MTSCEKLSALTLSLLLCIFGSTPPDAYAQSITCTGAFGDVMAGTDFGRGSDLYPPGLDPVNVGPDYTFIRNQPEDSRYTITKSTGQMYFAQSGSWHSVTNHTPNDPNGYMMVINSHPNPGVIYQLSIDVCANTIYEFSAFVINLQKTGTIPQLNPDLSFSIHNVVDDAVITTYQTGEIEQTPQPEWKNYTVVFKTPPNAYRIMLKIRNETPGGVGNDLALDDLAFRACRPLISTTIGGLNIPSADYCEGTAGVSLKATMTGEFETPEYQWQINKGSSWDDIPGQRDLEALISFSGLMPGTYRYRLAAAEAANFGSADCSTYSPELTINILPKPSIPPSPAIINTCFSDPVQLNAGGGTSYSWAPASGLSATDIPNPIAKPTKTTTYTVTVSNGTCYDTHEVTVKVFDLPKVNAGDDQEIREGQSVRLKGIVSENGVNYHWSPADFLDDPNSLTPIATPKKSINYTLIASSAPGCTTVTDEVFIKVIEKLKIPNTFSPNDDGINDLWKITSIETYPGASLKVMNRNGETVFMSRGTHYAWDGKYKNKDVPAGTYYYVIDLGEGHSKQSGWVLIAR